MTSSVNLAKNHLALSSCNDVATIMSPLLQPHQITTFNYYRIYFDNSLIRLSSDSRWTEHFFRKNYLSKMSVPTTYVEKPLNYYIWLTEDCPELLLDAAINFDTSNGISIAKRHENSIEYFCFATSTANQKIINNFYLGNLDKLLRFSDHFIEQAADLLKLANVNKFQLKTTEHSLSVPTSLNLSKRQIQCSQLLLKGMTQKEIGKSLKLSPRTVETYLNQVRLKLDCQNKAELILKISIMQQHHLLEEPA